MIPTNPPIATNLPAIVPVASIAVTTRHRGTNIATVTALAADIAARGLINPITLWRRPDGVDQLCAGAHRLAAYKQIGVIGIPVTFIPTEGLDEETQAINAEFVELQENLLRQNLSAAEQLATVDRAMVLTERKARIDAARKAAEAKVAADAAVKAAKTEADKKVARGKQSDAIKTVTRTTTALDNRSRQGDLLSSDNVPARLAPGVPEQLSKDLGLRTGTIKNVVSEVRAIGRRDLAVLCGATQRSETGTVLKSYEIPGEVGAYKKLVTEHPEQAKQFIAKLEAAKTSNKNWPDTASRILQEINRENSGHQTATNAMTQAQALQGIAQEVKGGGTIFSVKRHISVLEAAGGYEPLIARVERHFDETHKLMRAILDSRDNAKQKVTGSEHKYGPKPTVVIDDEPEPEEVVVSVEPIAAPKPKVKLTAKQKAENKVKAAKLMELRTRGPVAALVADSHKNATAN